jgi:predicted HAD superfamily hydrolase
MFILHNIFFEKFINTFNLKLCIGSLSLKVYLKNLFLRNKAFEKIVIFGALKLGDVVYLA